MKKRVWTVVVLAILMSIGVTGAWLVSTNAQDFYTQLATISSSTGTPSPSENTPPASPSLLGAHTEGPELGQPSKTTHCQAQGPLPDFGCTPGAIFTAATRDDVCTSGYSKSVRDVPQKEKEQVYSMYGVLTHTTGEYEVDHLISLELGGSNDVSNLWPEPAEPTPGFHEKDKVENYLHTQVCAGLITLPQAQKIIATDWMSAYEQLKQLKAQ